jgi:hypothetical protein
MSKIAVRASVFSVCWFLNFFFLLLSDDDITPRPTKAARKPPPPSFDAADNEGSRHSQWCDLFRQLCEFKVQFGHCLVPQQYAANPKLGTWVSRQRTNFRLQQEGKRSPMNEERIRGLDVIGFDWGTDFASLWSARFQELEEYKDRFGNCLVPRQYSANLKLGNWVNAQRSSYSLYREGKPSCMTEERIRALNVIGFDWGTDFASIWSARFQELEEYKDRFGNCFVPAKNSANPKLGQWVSTQRRNYKMYQEGKPSPMTEKRIGALENPRIGFKWKLNNV